MKKNCFVCGTQFRTFPCYELKGKPRKYCSKKCSDSINVPLLQLKRREVFTSGIKKFGRPVSEITSACIICDTMFSSKKYEPRKTCSKECLTKYKKNIQSGCKHSDESKQKMSKTRKALPPVGFIANKKFGKDNPRWKGGITPINEKIRKSPEYKIWRTCVYQRDNYTCVFCGVKGSGKNLNADHIKPFSTHPELRFDINNGRTLCVECHRKTPTYGFLLFNKTTKIYKKKDENLSLKFK